MSKHGRFRIKSTGELQELALSLGLDIPLSMDLDILLEPSLIEGFKVPNKIAVQPMEGFDSTTEGAPGELSRRRYMRYAAGGSGIIWFEATSVTQEGRSNPRQLLINNKTVGDFRELVDSIREEAKRNFGLSHNPFIVLQLTHSGRFSKPEGKPVHKCFSPNPYLDPPGAEMSIYSDDELDLIRSHFIEAINLAESAGFDSVDIKISHGYLLHEIMTSFGRNDSRFGGSFGNRLSFVKEIVSHPSRIIKSIRLNATDLIPYPFGFGMQETGSPEPDLREPMRLIDELKHDVPLWNITAGVPYYNSFVNRPYDTGLKGSAVPPEHPLEGVARLIELTGIIQERFRKLPIVGSGYSWLRQFFPNVGAGVIREGKAGFTGLGRSSFAYPDAPRDLMEKGALDPAKVCICCSDCTQLMRNNSPTGCTRRDREFYSLKR
jgi:2,4-dienoyl-CoA reductase-like NADH-dependent reductase (Old Yellow Enzyme family)